MASKEVFQKNLPYYMSKAGMNQVELSKAIDVSKSTVSTWLSGRSFPRMDVLQKMADVLNCTTDDLVSESSEATLQQISDNQKTLFRLSKNATPEAIRAAIAVLKSFENTNSDF